MTFRMHLYLLASGLIWMVGCPSVSSTQKRATSTNSGYTGRRFVLTQTKRCRMFHDRRVGLSFCVPSDSTLQLSRNFDPTSQRSFEARIVLAQAHIEIHLRQDPLSSDLPEGALSGPWLLRYAEVYARAQGHEGALRKKRILHLKHRQYIRVQSAVWATFSPASSSLHQREEVLVLSQTAPSMRYIISIRIHKKAHHDHRALRRTLVQILRYMRWGKRKG